MRNRELLPEPLGLDFGDLLKICRYIAAGMLQLSHRRIVHRDLACRNILISLQHHKIDAVKISDFGLSWCNNDDNDEGEHQDPNLASLRLPIKWSAIEAIRDGTFSSASDVWSMAVTMWEIFNRGTPPFQDRTNQEAYNFVKTGGRLELPDLPSKISELMLQCWDEDPSQRPSFSNILNVIDDVIKDNAKITMQLRSPCRSPLMSRLQQVGAYYGKITK
eukprot:TRINITY_DN9050_c0_g1_i3.p1 TRINITY_DN9050_c0_g1~~TRINITY_DN9050_c0_g1_i3.p1  ORF type:complete len:219 (+),score=17.28 TRINITY_DN9050_c0_g1_i3:73-729(+)